MSENSQCTVDAYVYSILICTAANMIVGVTVSINLELLIATLGSDKIRD